MDIIDFFRSIDGITYWIILPVNTILIFAIIGYLGEKNKEKIVKMGMQANIPSGGLNFSSPVSERHNVASIPTVAPTSINNNMDVNIENNGIIPNQVSENSIPILNQGNTPNVVNQPIANNQILGQSAINSPVANEPVMVQNINSSVANNQPGMFVNNSVETPQINNEVAPDEKPPAILVINSDNTEMPK